MNKIIKAMLICFSVFLFIGVISVVVAFGLGATGYDFMNSFHVTKYLRPFRYEKMEDFDKSFLADEKSVSANEVKKLKIDMKSCEFVISETTGDEIEATVLNKGLNYITMKMDGDTFEIKDHRNNFENHKAIKVELLIPKNSSFEEVKVDVGAGEFVINAPLHAKDIQIDAGAGTIDAIGLFADEFQASLGAGAVTIVDAEFGEMKIDGGVGECKISNCKLNGDGKVDTGVGNIAIGLLADEKDFNYKFECGVGEIRVFDTTFNSMSDNNKIDNGAPHTIELENGVGGINIYKADNF
ncbi:MAG: DUF4097 family beta strand repeat-containing protein [bacterium]|nr:DUF4097 family beta strand repeat-containing protein [bacterium]